MTATSPLVVTSTAPIDSASAATAPMGGVSVKQTGAQLVASFGAASGPVVVAGDRSQPLGGAGSSCEQLIDRYRIACHPVRDVLVDYLRERQPSVDFSSLQRFAYLLGKLFWADLEAHHPGIDSLKLPREVAAAWRQRVMTRTAPRPLPLVNKSG